jgi:hypothetical protein
MAQKSKNSKPLLLSFKTTRKCKCGAEYDVTDSLNLDTGHETGQLHECPHCGSEFDYIQTGTNFYDVAKKFLDGLEDWREGEMLSGVTSVKRARKILRIYIR